MSNPIASSGFSIGDIAAKCFVAMLSNDSWYTRALKDSKGDVATMMQVTAGYAITAAQQLATAISGTTTTYQ